MRTLKVLSASIIFALSATPAFSDPPAVVIQAATVPASTATAQTASTIPSTPTSIAAAIKLLEAMKSSNAETLSKQEATLGQLDDLQKAADQTRIFSHRKSG